MGRKHKRSKDGQERRNEKKRKRVRTKASAIPYTNTDKQRNQPPEREVYINFPYIHSDLHNGTLIHFLKDVIPSKFVKTLQTTTSILIEVFKPTKHETCRGEQLCYYFGHWRDSSKNIIMCPHTKNPAFSDWFNNNKPLFEFLGDLLKEHYPKLYEQYETLSKEYRLFGPWSMAILNIDSPSVLHTDFKDWHNGFCTVITFGDYEGELHFPLLNITLNIEEKDVALFQSHKLEHGNKDIVGTRHSLVLVSHNTLFNLHK